MSAGSGLVLGVGILGAAFIVLLAALLLMRRRLSIARKELAATASALKDSSDSESVQRSELLVAQEIQKAFFPIPPDGPGHRPSIGTLEQGAVEICGYNQGAGPLTGDVIGWERVSNDHYLILQGDVAGHGAPAALFAIQVNTIFREWCRCWQPDSRAGQLLYHINDMLVERRDPGRFASIFLGLVDVRTGEAKIVQAASESILWFKANDKKSASLVLPQNPAAGMFSSDLLRERSAYTPVSLKLEIGDVLFFLSDGLEESHRERRDVSQACVGSAENPGESSEKQGPEFFGINRIREILDSVLNRRSYILQGDPETQSSGRLSFDFSGCARTATEAVLALVSVEKVFRLKPQRTSGDGCRVEVERDIHRFLKVHFEQYAEYFSDRAESDGGYVLSFDHLQEGPQYDDISIVAVRRTEGAESMEAKVPEELAAWEVTEDLEELPVVDDDEEGSPLPDGESVN